MTYYDELGLTKDVNQEEIKYAYRRKASEHHPDKGGEKERFQRVQKAYEVLNDPVTKANYDRNGCSETEPDSVVIDRIITEVLINIIDSGQVDIRRTDLVQTLTGHFARNQSGLKQNIAVLKQNNKKYRQAIKRMKSNNSIIGSTIYGKRLHNIRVIEELTIQCKMGNKILDVLKDYQYKTDTIANCASTGNFNGWSTVHV